MFLHHQAATVPLKSMQRRMRRSVRKLSLLLLKWIRIILIRLIQKPPFVLVYRPMPMVLKQA